MLFPHHLHGKKKKKKKEGRAWNGELQPETLEIAVEFSTRGTKYVM